MSALQTALRLSDAQARVIAAMEPSAWYTASQLQTSGALLMALTDFKRELRGTAPPIQLLFWERIEPEGLRIWQLSSDGEEVRDKLPIARGTVTACGEEFRRFIPYPGSVTDGTARCLSCGQIDEPDWHDDALCLEARQPS